VILQDLTPYSPTSDIRPISKYLADVVGFNPEEVKSKLDIGRLYRTRCDLVHHGQLKMEVKQIGEVFIKLENICREILRKMSGLPYSGTLDIYFR
jgi:hypothetical protein